MPAINPASLGLPGAGGKPVAAWAPPAPPKPEPPAPAPAPAAPAHGPKNEHAPIVNAVVDKAMKQMPDELASRAADGETGPVSREVVEKVAWEVVPELAETMLKEKLGRNQ
jgi:hypothetical protein